MEDLARLLLAAVEFSDDAIVTKTLDGHITSWNPAAERMFEFSAEEAVGQPIFIIVPDDKRAEEADILRRLNDGERVNHFETTRRSKSGRVVDVSLSVSPVRSDEGHIIGATKIARDITRQKENDRVLRQAQKMEAVGQLTGGVAHDFNNILTVITGTIDILAEGVRNDPELLSIVEMIGAAAGRGSELTSRLLSFSRKQPLLPVSTDVNSLVNETVELLRHTLPENIGIVRYLDPNVTAALVDPDQLITGIINLALNARDAMPDGGRLTIETADASLDDDYVAMNPESTAGEYLMIAVSDSGSGIAPEHRDRVFDPFFTTKGAGRGSGLGLSMVYGFVKQSGGHIKLYSEIGVGTTFKLYLPQATTAAVGKSKRSPTPVLGGQEVILLVEDDRLVRATAAKQLRGLGYDVIATESAAEALAVIEQVSNIDLLFTDVVLTGALNGKQLADKVRLIRPDIKIVFASGYTENAIIHHGRLDPGVLLLTKPYRRDDLARILRRALTPLSAENDIPS